VAGAGQETPHPRQDWERFIWAAKYDEFMQKGANPFGPVLALIVGLATAASAQEVQHLNVTQRGGFPGRPVMNGITKTTNGVNVMWDGPAGYYQLYLATELGSPDWQPVGAPNLNRIATLTNISGNAFFKVAGPAAQYAGSQACAECHEGVHGFDENTPHAKAFQTLKAIGRDTNPTCLRCHTVGFGLPTGFTSEFATPQLAGVQCESCHGPAAAHAANEMDLTKRPRKELASQVCGGCHNGFHNNTFDDWKSSGHFAVVEDMNPAGRINSCGRCHSGSARLALIKGENPSITVTNDANVGITCAVCHDPHQNHVWTNVLTGTVITNQLRQALVSTNDFSLSTSENFTAKYNPNINVCAQCHNHRGATWTSSGRPPHHSPQYNMLLGTVGELPAGTTPFRAAHAGLEKQCVTCHMPKEVVTGSHRGLAGHSFQVESFEACQSCHVFPELLVNFTAMVISSRIQQVKADLDLWGTTKAPLALRTKYGALAWEYTTPGELSTGTAGPNSSEQAQVPDNIKRARFNLYIVKYDGSYGSHNPLNAINLLEAARTWVQEELNQ
jgi:nitrate/TMAO reductase-like tetraheme cytochrome c subunit